METGKIKIMLKTRIHSTTFSRACSLWNSKLQDLQVWKVWKPLTIAYVSKLVTSLQRPGFLTATCTLVSWPPDDAHCTGLMIQGRALLSTPSRRILRWRHLEREGSGALAGSCHTVVVAKAGETLSARAPNCCATRTNDAAEKQRYIYFLTATSIYSSGN